MAVCANCSSRQPDEAVFCSECGAPLAKGAPASRPAAQHPRTVLAATCPACGVSVTAGSASCPNCGATLSTAAPAPPTGAPVCSKCGAPLEPDASFCDMCGARVSTAPAPSAPEPAVVKPPPQLDPLATPLPPAARRPSPAILGRLIVQTTKTTLPLPSGKTEIIIGREDPVSGVFPEIDLTSHGGEEGGVSRRHARLTIQGTQLFIEDLNSTNYTYVNRKRLSPGQPHLLSDGDEIRLGRVKLDFRR